MKTDDSGAATLEDPEAAEEAALRESLKAAEEKVKAAKAFAPVFLGGKAGGWLVDGVRLRFFFSEIRPNPWTHRLKT